METEIITETVSEDISAAWNEEEPDQPTEDPLTEPEPTPEPVPATEEPKPEEPKPEAEPQPVPETFQLKHMDETRSVTKDEVVTLAQKGMDYDRIREERDQLKTYKGEVDPAYSIVKSFAEKSGMSIGEYVDFCRKQELLAQGVNEQTADAQVAVEKHRVELEALQAQADTRKKAEDAERQRSQAQDEARQKDFSDFIAKYPAVKAEEIPAEVWAMVKEGQSLISAYTMHKNQQLTADLAAERKNKENAQRSPGSMENPGTGEDANQISRWWHEADE